MTISADFPIRTTVEDSMKHYGAVVSHTLGSSIVQLTNVMISGLDLTKGKC